MSSIFAKLDDDLMKVPKLEAGSTNWVVYKGRFLWSVDVHRLLEHVDGSEREPVCPVKPWMVPRRDSKGNETWDFVQAAYTQEEEKLIKEWKQGEAIIKQQIALMISDLLFIKIQDKDMALKIWEALQQDFQNKSQCLPCVTFSLFWSSLWCFGYHFCLYCLCISIIHHRRHHIIVILLSCA